MAIDVECDCGYEFTVKDSLAGRRTVCPECDATVRVPGMRGDEFQSEDTRRRPSPVTAAERPRRRRERDSSHDDDDEGDARTRRRDRRVRENYDGRDNRRGYTTQAQAGIGGGIFMIVAGIAWLFLGLAADRLYFYPPILIGLGIVALIKGIVDGSR